MTDSTSTHYDPPDIEFFDVATNQMMKYVDPSNKAYGGWLCYKHPDGQWVTLRKATPEDVAKINALMTDSTKEVSTRELEQLEADSGYVWASEWPESQMTFRANVKEAIARAYEIGQRDASHVTAHGNDPNALWRLSSCGRHVTRNDEDTWETTCIHCTNRKKAIEAFTAQQQATIDELRRQLAAVTKDLEASRAGALNGLHGRQEVERQLAAVREEREQLTATITEIRTYDGVADKYCRQLDAMRTAKESSERERDTLKTALEIILRWCDGQNNPYECITQIEGVARTAFATGEPK